MTAIELGTIAMSYKAGRVRTGADLAGRVAVWAREHGESVLEIGQLNNLGTAYARLGQTADESERFSAGFALPMDADS